MTSVDVIGGVYGERCAFPHWDEIYGSAGRAAAALSGHVGEIKLHTVLPDKDVSRIRPIFESFGVDVSHHQSKRLVGFEYLHCLSTPTVYPSPAAIEKSPDFEVEADVAVLFGMMECSPRVSARVCVYDPQSPSNPKGFRETGGAAERLAFVANSGELKRLVGQGGAAGAQLLLEREAAELVLVKQGLDGALVVGQNGVIGQVPAYETSSVFTIGSGDVFVAAFTLAWGIQNRSPLEAAEYASQAAATYIETAALPIIPADAAAKSGRQPVYLKGGTVYLAGPFRELGQRALIDEARTIMQQLRMTVFSPVHDIGHGPAEEVVAKDLEAIRNCDALFAILNGSSPGTLFEVGYSVRGEQPVYCVAQNMREVDLKLPYGSGCNVFPDFVTALHHLAWRK